MELNQLLSTPPILVCPKENSPFTLYLAISEKAISLVLVQDNDGDKRPIYFFSKVFKGVEICYQKIERLALAIVIIARKLIKYFQGHPIIVKTNYPIKRIFQKPDMAGGMVAWVVEQLEYDIMYAPRNNIKL